MEEETKAYIFISIGVLVVILALCFNYFRGYSEEPSEPVHFLCFSDNCVTRVIDGDTFQLRNDEIVRLICVDAPELSKPGGQEAKAFLENLVLGRDIRLESDIDNKDEYGRLLRYVWVNVSVGEWTGPDGDVHSVDEEVFVNRELVRSGNADVWEYDNDTKRCEEIEG